MPEPERSTRTTKEEDAAAKRQSDEHARDARAAGIERDSRETEERSEGRGFAEERNPAATEHESGRIEGGSAV